MAQIGGGGTISIDALINITALEQNANVWPTSTALRAYFHLSHIRVISLSLIRQACDFQDIIWFVKHFYKYIKISGFLSRISEVAGFARKRKCFIIIALCRLVVILSFFYYSEFVHYEAQCQPFYFTKVNPAYKISKVKQEL